MLIILIWIPIIITNILLLFILLFYYYYPINPSLYNKEKWEEGFSTLHLPNNQTNGKTIDIASQRVCEDTTGT